uniref:Uncharacterized protein n=1 Tax=Aegilops tauschii subsp. strangulata TaxID=200361 RepID=A0A453L8V2_AEGTS
MVIVSDTTIILQHSLPNCLLAYYITCIAKHVILLHDVVSFANTPGHQLPLAIICTSKRGV